MKKLLFVSCLYLLIDRAAASPSFDPFADATAVGGTSYPIGAALTNQSNPSLFSPWYSRGANSLGTTEPTIVAGNLTYPNMPPSTGNSVSFIGAFAKDACLDLNLPGGHTNTVYASFLLKITDLSAVVATSTNNPFACFLDDPSPLGNTISRIGTRLLTKKVGSGYVLGTSRSAASADFVYEPDAAAHSVGDVVLVVMAYQRNTSAAQTNVSVWINPPASSLGSNQPPAPTLLPTAGNAALNTAARAFGIIEQFPGAPTGIIDDVRVSTNNWAYVTGGDPAITQNPANQTLPAGANATFTVVARGTPTLAYRWIKDGTTLLTDGGNISGATTATLHVNNVSVSDVASYAVYVTNGLGSFVQSASAQLSLSDPSITSQPQSRTNDFGTTATFQVTALGTGPFTYQWHKEGVGDLSDGGNISGSHSNILTVTGVSFPDHGNFSVTVSNAVGTADSTTAVLTVRDPLITSPPSASTNNAGTTATFHVAAIGSGAGSFTYQWLKNTAPLSDGGNISGALTDTLMVSTVSAADQAFYSVVVTGTYDSATSSDALLTVISPIVITAQPTPRTVLAGAKTAFAIGVSGTAPSYQWRLTAADIPGATSHAYTLTNAQVANQGGYSVVISNSINVVTSSVATLTITPLLHLYGTNLAVIRVGDGAQFLTANGNSMFLDEFSSNGSYISTLNIPETGASAMITLGPNTVPSPSSATGTTMSRSLDGRFLVVAGYNTPVGYNSELNTSSAASVPRGIGLLNSSAQYNLAVSSTNSAFNSTFFRSAVTDGTNNYWGSGRTPGTYYFGFDAPAVLVQNQFSNIRSMAQFNGDIYCVSAVGGNNGVLKLAGMPMTASTGTILFPGSTSSSDLEVRADGNLIYVADDRTTASGGGVQRWEFDGSIWSLAYTLTDGVANGVRYVTANFSGPNPIVYAISREETDDNNRIVMIEDTGAGSTGATLAFAGANQNFRGVRFGPIESAPSRPTLFWSRSGANLILSWTGPFTLVTATNVTGPYLDVSNPTNPYTNSITVGAQRFFGLRQ